MAGEEEVADFAAEGRERGLALGQGAQQCFGVPGGQVAVAGAEDAQPDDGEFVVEVEQCVADDLEEVGQGQGERLGGGLQVQQQARGDQVGVGVDEP